MGAAHDDEGTAMAKLIRYRDRDDGQLDILFSDGSHWLTVADLVAAKATFPEPNFTLHKVEPPGDTGNDAASSTT